ncbi:ATP-binding protein [Niabella sp. CJ426]|uniref:ATP-binding protein n=1 Tax=Niabella sp. CJ426 TaxID=3393740 RepID=UPI003D06579D
MPNTDSLMQIARSAREDSIKIKALLVLSDAYENNDPEKAISYSRQAVTISIKSGYEKGIMSAYRNLAYIFTLQSRYDSLMHYNKLVYEMAEKKKDVFNMGVSLYNMGEGYKYLGDYEKSIDHTFRALKILEGKGYDNIEANLYGGLQSTYYKLKQYDKSVGYGLTGIALARKNKSEGILIVLLENMGHCYADMKQYAKAEDHYDEAILLARQRQDKINETICYEGKIDIALNENRYNDIKKYADKTMSLSVETANASGICTSHYNLGLYYMLIREYNKANEETLAALKIARENKLLEHEAQILNHLSIISAARHDISGSIEYAKLAEEINNKIFTDGVAEKDAAMRNLYETGKIETQIKLQQATIRQKNILNYFLIGGALALVVILLLSYRNYRNRRKIQQHRINELETEKQLLATQSLLKGQEDERSRLAKDLHDGLGGLLSGVKLQLGAMKGNLILTEEHGRTFNNALNKLDESISEMRRVAHNMMPEALMKLGLQQALQDYCDSLSESQPFTINTEFYGLEQRMEASVEIVVYRIVQELVNNAVKHSGATTILAQVIRQDSNLSITVEDNGKGFETERSGSLKSAGLHNIQSRVHYLHGQMDIQSSPGKGTSVHIDCTINNNG